jgi:hypothetical protein
MPLNDAEFERVIANYRDTPILGLSFTPAIERLLDKHTCQAIQSEFELSGHAWECKRATDSLAPELPRLRGIYMFVWSPGPVFRFANERPNHHATWVLYVGKAGVKDGTRDTFQDRYRSEYQKYLGQDPTPLWERNNEQLTRARRLQRFLSLRPIEYWYLPVNQINYIVTLEKRLVQIFKPPLNTQHGGPRARFGETQPAW